MVDWLLDLVPLWVWVIAAVAAAFGAWRLLGTRGLLGAIAGLGAFLAYRTGRERGGADAAAKQKKADEKAVKDHDKIAADTDRMSDDELDASNAPWVRKRGR